MRRGALSRRAFRLLFAAQAVSALGDRLAPVALAFAVLDLTGSVGDLGIVLAAQTAPLLLFVLVGGVWSDRLSRQRVMIASDAARATAQATSAALLLSGQARIWQLVALQAAYGAAAAFFGPASLAVVPETVETSELQQANALLGMSGNVSAVLGPALAGVLVATVGAAWGLAADAGTFVASAFCLAGMRAGARPARTGTRMLSELREGWRAFRSRTWLWVTVVFFALFLAVGFSPFLVLGPQVARLHLGGAGAWAAISVALGLGSIAGGLLGLRWHPRFPLRASLLVFLIAGPALLAALAAHASLALILALAVVDGSSGTLFNTLWFTALQREIPAGELSRVSSWDYLGSLALVPVGQAVSGPVAAAVGVSATLYAAAGLSAALLLGILAVPAVRNFNPDQGAKNGVET